MAAPAVTVCPPAEAGRPARACPLCGDPVAVGPAALAALALGAAAVCRVCAPLAADPAAGSANRRPRPRGRNSRGLAPGPPPWT